MLFIAMGLFEDVAMFGSKILTSNEAAVYVTMVSNLLPLFECRAPP